VKTIFVVDDVSIDLTQVEDALEDVYNVMTFLSASRMFAVLDKVTPDLILLDIVMPEMDGFAILEKLMANEITSKIPVIFFTVSIDNNVEARCLELGAVDFITKPFSPLVLRHRIAHQLHVSDIIKKRTERIEQLQNNIIFVLADMVESRDKLTSGHVERTSIYVEIIAEAMQERGLYKEEMVGWYKDMLILSARLHDIGKISIPDFVLNKPGKLSPEEFEIMKTHPSEGERIIDRIITRTGGSIFLQHAKFFAGYHHENWDGSGYPRKLKGEDIPLQGRIMAIADVYDALVSERPYKMPFTHDEAVRTIVEDAGRKFDPKIAEVFFEVKDKFRMVMS